MKKSNLPLLELVNVRRSFAKNVAVDDVSLTVYKGEILGIIGRSGAGKSTLIRCINGLDQIDSGAIFFEGQNISHIHNNGRRQMRRHIGMIFQHFNLISSRSVIDNVALPLKLAGKPRQYRRNKALELLELVGLADKAYHYPLYLSGGQKQRIAVARALAANPGILLSDEATSSLDPETTQSILELLSNLNRQMDLTIILITHEMEVVRMIANRLVVLDQGKIVEEGSVKDIFTRPQSNTTKSLLQSVIPALPSSISARLDPVHGKDAIIELHISGEEANKPFLNNLEAETGAVARIIQGGIETVQHEAVGHFFLAITANDRQRLEKACAWLTHHGDKSEVLGYV